MPAQPQQLPIERFVQNPQNLTYRILGFDPGESVGWSIMEGGKVVKCGQLASKQFQFAQLKALEDLIVYAGADVVVYEAYLIYSWKATDHTWNEVHTAQIIGIIRFLCSTHGIPYTKQTAQIAKQFCTDEKLKAWGFWQKGEKHARDSIRHACYWTMFGKLEEAITGMGTPD